MKKNVGGPDRVFRIVGGLTILSLYFVLPPAWRLTSLAGIVPLLTGVFAWCPAYLPFRFQTSETGQG